MDWWENAYKYPKTTWPYGGKAFAPWNCSPRPMACNGAFYRMEVYHGDLARNYYYRQHPVDSASP